MENFKNDKIFNEYNILKKNFFDIKNIDCVLDVGANIGYQALFYKNFFNSNTEIISVPKHESHRLTNLGIASIAKGKTNHLKEEVQVKKFDDLDVLKSEYKSIFIKIDVEGYEKQVLIGMNNFFKKK